MRASPVLKFRFRPSQSVDFKVDLQTAELLLNAQSNLIHKMMEYMYASGRAADPEISRQYLDLMLLLNSQYQVMACKATNEASGSIFDTDGSVLTQDKINSMRAAYYSMLRNMKRRDALIRLSERFSISWSEVAKLVD